MTWTSKLAGTCLPFERRDSVRDWIWTAKSGLAVSFRTWKRPRDVPSISTLPLNKARAQRALPASYSLRRRTPRKCSAWHAHILQVYVCFFWTSAPACDHSERVAPSLVGKEPSTCPDWRRRSRASTNSKVNNAFPRRHLLEARKTVGHRANNESEGCGHHRSWEATCFSFHSLDISSWVSQSDVHTATQRLPRRRTKCLPRHVPEPIFALKVWLDFGKHGDLHSAGWLALRRYHCCVAGDGSSSVVVELSWNHFDEEEFSLCSAKIEELWHLEGDKSPGGAASNRSRHNDAPVCHGCDQTGVS